MKAGLYTEIDWGLIGSTLAKEDDESQALFFKSFIKEMERFGTYYQAQNQLAAINIKLKKEEKEFMRVLVQD